MKSTQSRLKDTMRHRPLSSIDVSKAVSVAIIVSILLIIGGIWNGIDTSKLSKKNTETSLMLQKLSTDLRFYEEAMSNAVNMALATGEPDWEASYENSAQKIQETIAQARIAETVQALSNVESSLTAIIEVERQLFTMINDGNYSAAFDFISTDTYQELKIQQAQNALSLRAALDKRAQAAINSIQSRLANTNLLFILQFVILCGIWAFVIRIVRNWHRQQAKYSEDLATLAHYDSLTSIGNRALFHIKLEEAIEQSRRSHKPFALLLMDIDHFKDINDNLGHNTGDELLIDVARSLSNTIRNTDTVARLGGDEFAIIATNLDDKFDSAALAKKVLAAFEKPKHIAEHVISTSTSIGIAFYPNDAQTQSELLRKSDMALYEAKRAGRANYKNFDIAIELEARERVQLKLDIEEAIEADSFELYYQPLVDMQTNRVVSVEALMRWKHPTKGFIAPSQFIPIAEASQLVIPIGKWVTKTACLQQTAWAESGIPPINVSVNLSAVQFKERNLIENISQIIKDTGINPKNLTLEITESTIMETGPEVIQQLSALNGLGLKLAIDDFGTGYSSLAYLKQFPIHYLKIDRAFVQDLPDDKEDCAITRAVIGMARELNLGVVAEGIETPEQMAFLREEGCNYGQGYFIGRPMPRQEFEQWYQHFLNNKTLSIAVDNDSRNSDKDSGSSPKAQDG